MSETYPWLAAARQTTHAFLVGAQDRVERVFARPIGRTVRVYLLFSNTTYDHASAVAYGRLEVELRSLVNPSYDDVVIELIPSWGVNEDELEALRQRSMELM